MVRDSSQWLRRVRLSNARDIPGTGAGGMRTLTWVNRQGIEEIGVRRGALVYKGPDPDPRYRHRR